MKEKIKKQDTTELIPYEQGGELAKINPINKSLLESWNMIRKALSEKPKDKEISTNPFANNSKFIPIGVIENKLDLIYSGLWKTSNFRYSVVANEIVGVITLEVYLNGIGWISREGVGATMIQQNKGAELSDINAKIKNTLTKDFPHLKAECLKNACKSLGDAFGRYMNRDSNGDYQMYYSESELLESAKQQVKERLNFDNMVGEGLKIFKEFELQMNDVEKKALQDFIRDTKIIIKKESEGKNG